MLGVRSQVASIAAIPAIALAVLVCLTPTPSRAQPGNRYSPAGANTPARKRDNKQSIGPQFRPVGPEVLVVDVRVKGLRNISENTVRSHLRTRKDRLFDPEIVQADVRRLISSKLFSNIRTSTEKHPGGILVTFEVFERPTIQYFKIVGNRKIKDKTLFKKVDLKKGEALNYYSVEQARRTVEEYYHSKGYPQTEVSIWEGDRPGDRGVVLKVDEGRLQKIWHVEFIGNKIASDGRLKTQIKSKPGFLKVFFPGKVNRNKIEEDVDRLTAYYRQLGYFGATIQHDLQESDSGDWLTVRYVIREGPRYKVRNVSVVGNKKYSSEALATLLKLKSGDYFHALKMTHDVSMLKDLYGSQGHYFADIKADPRFLEDGAQIDLIYDIEEGEVWRVGRINVHMQGEFSHTRHTVVLNRISLRPGDIIDTRQIRASERRLKASQLFENDPRSNAVPRIVVKPPDLRKAERSLAEQDGRRTTRYRGQSPDSRYQPRVRYVDVDVLLPRWKDR